MQWNKYVGIPYLDKGRDPTIGLDCWGLSRYVYSEEFNIQLPDFSGEYTGDDTKRISELISIHKESWEKVEEPKPGHLILFRILGEDIHVGIYIGNNKFLHSIEGQYSAIERLDGHAWKNRISGFFKYTEKSIGGTLTAVPHPLRTETITVPVPEGTTVKALSNWIVKEYKITDKLIDHIAIVINGKVISKEDYETVTVNDGDVVQYRALPGKSVLRMVLAIVITIVAVYYVGPAATQLFGSKLAGALAAAAFSVVGQLLLNAIFPIRPPAEPGDPGNPARQLLMLGGTNQANKYGPIPVVLGKVRMTAMLGGKNYVESSDEKSDLNMLLVWGFGPLAISDLYIGLTNIDQYENGVGKPVVYAHLNDTLEDDPYADVDTFNSIYANDIEQNYHGIRLVNNATDGNPWTESTLVEPDIHRLAVTYNFPQGLRHLVIKGESAGAIYAKECRLELQYRALDINGEPLYDWQDASYISKGAASFKLETGVYTYTDYYNDGAFSTTTNYYRWTRIALTRAGEWVTKVGAYCAGPYTEAIGPQYTRYNRTYDTGPNRTLGYVRLPQWTNDEIPIMDVCMFGNTIFTTDISARRPDFSYSGFSRDTTVNPFREIFTASVLVSATGSTGLAKTLVNAYANFRLNSGFVAKDTTVISLGTSNYVKRKDPFTHTQYISVPPNPGGYQVRTRRLNSDVTEPDDTNRYMHDVQLQTVTGYTNRKPVIDPPNCKVARTAMRIRATDQLNGQIEGINALVQTICLDWDAENREWKHAITNNPASLFRYVLQHPANAMRITEDETYSRIDMEALEDWHEYCTENGLEFNAIVASSRSVLDVLRDIAAAGRASPTTINGKWSIVIDRPRVDIVQHFTPHNSWGFESTKRLPKRPDGLKVTFNNEERGFQEEEIIVYAAGKNETNSEVFEQISLPGITKPDLVKMHTRWHFAQATLRPEIYSLNTDLEYIVATRGDRVKVMHDVTMWGLSSGRIKDRVNAAGTILDLDEPVPMKAGVNYSIRIRSSNGSSVVRNLVPVAFDNYYSRITLTEGTTVSEVSSSDLFMFGEVNTESNDLIILGIEPYGTSSAKITLTDYSPEIYNVDYRLNNFYVPEFDSKVSRPPELLIYSVTVAPTITSVVSDETVLERLSPGVFKYNLKIGYRHAPDLPERVTGVEVQIDYAEDVIDNWLSTGRVPLNQLAVTFGDVVEGDQYKIRARYVVDDGRTGPWSPVVTHTIVGKTTPPSAVSGFTKTFEAQSATFKLEWQANTEIDIKGYEIRTSDSGWGTPGYVFAGSELSYRVPVPANNAVVTYYIRAVDYSNNYSTVSAVQNTTIAPPSIPKNITYTYSIQSTTGTTAIIDWDTPDTVNLPISHYEIKLIKPTGTAVVNSLTTEYMTLVDWLAATTAEVTAVDSIGNRSPTASISMPKAPPQQPGVVTYSVTDSSIVLDWPDSAPGSLPVAGYEVRSADSNWGNSSYIARVSGSKVIIPSNVLGTNTWFIRAYDTAGHYSATRSITVVIAAPNPPSSASLELTDTTVSGAQALIKWTAAEPTTFAIKEYELTLTKYPGPVTQFIVSAGTSVSLPVDWRDSLSLSIRTVDVLGRKSNELVTNFTKAPPGQVPAVTTAAVKTGGVNLSWTDPVKGTLAIAGYEIRNESVNPGAPGFVYRGNINSAFIPTVSLGTNTWYIWAFDTDGHYSPTPRAIVFNVSAPAVPTGLTAAFNTSSNTSSTCILRWVSPVGSQYNISHYEATLAYSNPVVFSTSVNNNTTDWQVPATWMGTAVLTVRAVDVLGNQSAVATLNIVKAAPMTPGACTVTPTSDGLDIDWPDTPTSTLPVTLYELRDSDSGWGGAGYIWKGSSSNTVVALDSGTGPRTYYLKAIDSDNKYSTEARQITYTVMAPPNPTVYDAEFADTSLTAATVTLYWDPVDTVFGVKGYEVTYNGSSELINATTITLPANWLGDRNFTIKTVDNLNNKSVGAVIVATKLPPNPATNFRAQVIDNNVLLYWNLPAKTTLPLSHVSIRKGETWETAEVIGDKDGTFTSISELVGGIYKYWLTVVDTDNNMSLPVSLSATVSQPPDFVFNAEYISTFSGTKVNCVFDSELNNAVVLPVNTTETFATHFTDRSWTSPNSQIAAGFPVYIQPGDTSGYYEETFDYGTILGSSQITLTLGGQNVVGTPNVVITISTSTDNVSYTSFSGTNSVFATNFRYVRIRISVSQNVVGEIYRISSINVRLDAKQKSDAGTVAVSSLPTLGTYVNFNKEFIDIESITVSAAGTTLLTPVYDIKDVVLNGTYTRTSNVITVTLTDNTPDNNHGLVAGQKVRMYFTSGLAISGVYTVQSVLSAVSYTLTVPGPDTTGAVSTYPNSMRIYLFDKDGVRQSGTVSWAVRGY